MKIFRIMRPAEAKISFYEKINISLVVAYFERIPKYILRINIKILKSGDLGQNFTFLHEIFQEFNIFVVNELLLCYIQPICVAVRELS